MTVELISGDCLAVLPTLPADSIDACVCDPPYELDFMGKSWDRSGIAFDPNTWRAIFRVLKPGAHLLAFGGTRTSHRIVCAIEDAGFEIRDTVAWIYGQGMPKSLDLSKAFDKAAGAERQVVSEGAPVRRMIPGADQNATGSWLKDDGRVFIPQVTLPATALAREWSGWGTGLKPAFEPVVLARKPLREPTVIANVARFRTGGINVDACRVEASGRPLRVGDYKDTDSSVYEGRMDGSLMGGSKAAGETDLGRWPANVTHDGGDEVLDAFPDAPGALTSVRGTEPSGKTANAFNRYAERTPLQARSDSGSAARFYYCAKATKVERNGSIHPTVKPIALMRWLCRLVTPPGGTLLDPFAGTGTTGAAAHAEGFNAVLVEKYALYVEDCRRRIAALPISGGGTVPYTEQQRKLFNAAAHDPEIAREHGMSGREASRLADEANDLKHHGKEKKPKHKAAGLLDTAIDLSGIFGASPFA